MQGGSRTSLAQMSRVSSFKQNSQKQIKGSRLSSNMYTPQRSSISFRQNQQKYAIRFKSKVTGNNNGQITKFHAKNYITDKITFDDVMDLKQVFDAYDSTGMGVLLPNDIKLLLTQNGFQPNTKTVYEIVAEFDTEQTGGVNFQQFMKAIDTKPFMNQNKKQITAIFKKYDRSNKGYIDINDLREINRHLKENLDEETLKLMLQKADTNNDGKITFQDFYSVMVKTYC